MSGNHHVYIVAHCARNGLQGPVKVGITKSLSSRLASLQTGSPYRLQVAFDFTLPDRVHAAEVERGFHEAMSDFRLQGEWFDIEDPLYALETLTGIVFDLIESRYSGDERRYLLVESNAIEHLKTVTDLFWGLPHEQ